MHILALHTIPDQGDNSARLLAETLGITSYEAHARLRVAGQFPLVISVFSEKKIAEDTASRINSAGFTTIMLCDDEIESEERRMVVKEFILGERELVVDSRTAGKCTIDYRSVTLLLRGISMKRVTDTEIEKKRTFSMGKTLLTGGLMMTKSAKKEHTTVSESREGFIHIYDKENNIVVFRENSLVYASLGKMLTHSRSSNFTFVAAEIIRQCPAASYNDFLLNRGRQVQMLGPLFTPEEHLDIAISLMAKSLLHPGGRGNRDLH